MIDKDTRRIVSNFRRMANRADYRAAKWEQESKKLASGAEWCDQELSDYYAKIAKDMRQDAKVYRRLAKELSQP